MLLMLRLRFFCGKNASAILPARAHSNPTMKSLQREYYGIGELLIAFGIKYSIDRGCRGDVVTEAKTEQLAKHYETAFHATRIPSERSDGPKRYMLVEDAWAVFSKYLIEEEPA